MQTLTNTDIQKIADAVAERVGVTVKTQFKSKASIAEHLKVDVRTVYAMVNRGEIVETKAGYFQLAN
jgi:transposase